MKKKMIFILELQQLWPLPNENLANSVGANHPLAQGTAPVAAAIAFVIFNQKIQW